MKPYTVEIDIDLPRERVVELFDNAENLYKWQPGLESFEHLSGEPGKPGAKSRMVYQNGKHRIELTETITERNLPDEFNGRYEWRGGSNTLRNRFIVLGPDRTRWESTCAYQFKSFMMKMMGFFCAGMFRKQNMSFLRSFKAFAEEGRDVRDGAGWTGLDSRSSSDRTLPIHAALGPAAPRLRAGRDLAGGKARLGVQSS